jgi:hypothetical protein
MLNRKNSQASTINYKMAKTESIDRKARTRTLIQLGSLVSLSGLTSLLYIQEGEDLQHDLEAKDKAAMLLGALSEIMESDSSSSILQQRWLDKGIRILKMRGYQKQL